MTKRIGNERNVLSAKRHNTAKDTVYNYVLCFNFWGASGRPSYIFV